MSAQDNQQFDLAAVFPHKGDPRRPPEWYGRALLYTGIAVYLAWFLFQSWGKVEFVVLDIVISMFIALAMEPLVQTLVRHGWRRGVAAAVSLVVLVLVTIALLVMFGNMFVQQVTGMANGLPDFYEQMSKTIEQQTSWQLPAISDLGNEIVKNIQSSWVTDFAGQAISTTVGFMSFLLNFLTVLLVTYYICAAGPKMRRSMCQWMSQKSQRKFVLVWTVAQDQISSFLFSRTILAVINSVCMSIFMVIMHVPYWLPLAIFCGLVSQFVPTIGTYIGGALPILFAWGSNGLMVALSVLIFIVVYQQIENLIFLPAVSQRTMDLNPAIAFLSVLVLGSVFGALGAFLALPIAASFQVIFKTYTKRYELIDSPLMQDPKPVKKSKVVAGAEAFNEHVIQPVAHHIPRAASGSSARIKVGDQELDELRDQLYTSPTSDDLDSSETIAIPKNVVSSGAKRRQPLSGSGPEIADDTSPDTQPDPHGAEDETEARRSDKKANQPNRDNPRNDWR
ncbi:AI-2E family transporter [Bifidobacterium crudilactis]|jgi:predicted PurR-regulated permease PerM|uniref:AI-2E family transporter n=1 Tax=Bifidobacterium crudilactis TaxID=327277 RepID=A0A971CYV7_9BIFI|nr:AI-2E family transporter [Bifidobacterium crudilactis]MCI1868227.1 AI-2E family transporter [Bifidobacterium crudilactis]MDN5972770.1 AI-2E family transporter [Bifidobacterium crudilactis]MDN6001033.1 AI-2E family transporter [Bifidobacterium crudilactis]MDN6466559.1 AI-2E family transporter [Bifidobacterium crudilactis]MDN6523087.1 AI-2E family transporter [Bifidobacterium crudilactis]